MSPSIWTQCAGKSRLTRLEAKPWRVVEAQHLISTRKLVDSDDEQQLLEELIESAKPERRSTPGPSGQRLHYLLFTPFRYPPLRYGSRFGKRTEPSLWYGAESPRTAFAELAYYRLLFLEGTDADLSPLTVEVSLFQATVESEQAIDLTAAPFDAHTEAIASPIDYGEAQRLGAAMRRSKVVFFRYPSARDSEGGTNVGVFTPAAFSKPRPSTPQSWFCVATREGVEVIKKDVFRRSSHRFPRADFEVDGELPSPAV